MSDTSPSSPDRLSPDGAPNKENVDDLELDLDLVLTEQQRSALNGYITDYMATTVAPPYDPADKDLRIEIACAIFERVFELGFKELISVGEPVEVYVNPTNDWTKKL